jgi:hypothetical protein
MAGKEETPKCRKKTVTWTNEMIEDLIDFMEIHPINNVWNSGQKVFMHFPDKTNNILKMLQSNKNKNTEVECTSYTVSTRKSQM